MAMITRFCSNFRVKNVNYIFCKILNKNSCAKQQLHSFAKCVVTDRNLLLIRRNLWFVPRCSKGYWNKDWMPGPYPRTPQEREKAAQKYGLLPEDYEPYPDDGFAFGDYPMLPAVGEVNRDPYEDWDNPALKRNYGEPLHRDHEWYIEERIDPQYSFPYTRKKAAQLFFMIWGTVFFFIYATWNFKYIPPLMPKQSPYQGVKHYTFEPAE